MKNFFKFAFLALAITVSAAACSSSKTESSSADSDSLTVDTPAAVVDSLPADTGAVDTTKTDSTAH